MILKKLIRWRRPFFIAFALLFIIWSLSVAVLAIAIHSYGHSQNPQPADVIIVLGAGLRRDGRPGPALSRRAMQAAELWRDGYAPMLLCTGAQADGYPRSEAAACRETLIALGIPSSAIVLEEHSRSTEENAIYAQRIMEAKAWQNALIVSDSYHLLRAHWLFQRQAISASFSGVPVERIPFGIYIWSLLREILAFHWLALRDLLQLPITHIYGL